MAVMLKFFPLSAGILLLGTGIAKLFASFGSSEVLKSPDPVFGIAFSHLMLAVGAIEIVIGFICISRRARNLSIILIAWLSTSFCMYRVLVWESAAGQPCPCLGNLTDALRLRPETADLIAIITLGYLVLGSYILLCSQWSQNRKPPLNLQIEG